MLKYIALKLSGEALPDHRTQQFYRLWRGENSFTMDYSSLIDNFQGIACVLSVKKQDEGNEITLAAANKKYLESVNRSRG